MVHGLQARATACGMGLQPINHEYASKSLAIASTFAIANNSDEFARVPGLKWEDWA
jgi:hypothetical protein